MKPAAFEYERAASLEEAVTLLRGVGYDGKVLAGGQSLLPMLNLRLAQPACLIDISGLEALKRIEDLGEAVFIGAGVTHARIEDSAVPGRLGRILAGVAHDIAYRAVRSRGTVGGSLAHADPAADWPSVLLALGAEVAVTGPDGARQLPLSEFQQGAFVTALEIDEVLEGVILPKLSAAAGWGYYKFCRKPGEFAEAIGAVLEDPERGLHRTVMGATHGTPLLLDNFDASDAVDQVGRAEPGLDAYERRIHAVALTRAHREATT
ncbi:MAG: FAD binding domain-containing protein [Alphaproteobacteria bacterium]|nr:FAD binding domain-containing protein [Alphaproteobacteria bacterium]